MSELESNTPEETITSKLACVGVVLIVTLVAFALVGSAIWQAAHHGVVAVRDFQGDILEAVEKQVDQAPNAADAMATEFVRQRLHDCATTKLRYAASVDLYVELGGWHGLRSVPEEAFSSAANTVIDHCSKELVLGSASLQDARDRNVVLGAMGIAPVSSSELATLEL